MTTGCTKRGVSRTEPDTNQSTHRSIKRLKKDKTQNTGLLRKVLLSFTLKTILTLHLRKHLRLFPPDPAGPRKLIDATLAKQEKYSIETKVIVRDH